MLAEFQKRLLFLKRFEEDFIPFWKQCKEKKIPCVIDHVLSEEVRSLYYSELWH